MRFLLSRPVEELAEDNHPHGADNDPGVGNVKGGPAVKLQIDVEKVDNVAKADSINGVPDNAPNNQSIVNLVRDAIELELCSKEKNPQ